MNYVGILIQRKDGKMLFQLRDNNPNISNRNCWSLFGGGIKSNETPSDAAVRELKEELGISVKKEKLKLWIIIPFFKKKNYLFKFNPDKKLKLRLQEGADMGYFTIHEMRRKKNIVKTLKIMLYLYPIISLFKR